MIELFIGTCMGPNGWSSRSFVYTLQDGEIQYLRGYCNFSAGVGRTGTFIALDILYDQGTDKGSIDVFKCVDELRQRRVNMVQTKRYTTCLPVSIFLTLMSNSGTVSEKNSEDDIYTTAKKTDNKSKNRYDNILAPNEFRPFLLTQVPGCPDYINAVFIPGYLNKFGYILTQTALTSTAVDCCRLVYEQEVKIIVTFQEDGDDDVNILLTHTIPDYLDMSSYLFILIGIYLPEKGSVKLGPFGMTFVADENKRDYIRRGYQLTFQSEKRSVTQLMFKEWPPSSLTPSDPSKMLYFLEEVETLQRQNDDKPILAQCLKDAQRSGLIVVLMDILERLRFDKEVSISLVIRQLKIRRQQIIPNFWSKS
ncbi:receptor-type tyrosine-protein phosphatase mu-like [Mercenaria mercenaria]|uniref:receptor-type tyrosine-protein phosphatase mu-like n=1 Tax=Mercenaria mercenaria TaxID=6596 RepID=UPI00234EA888|nr:receptor-type tyrosine-protein phosphatase mu-like [Mercenaria mercenaria]